MSTPALVDYGLASRGRRLVEVNETPADTFEPGAEAGLKPAIAIIEPRQLLRECLRNCLAEAIPDQDVVTFASIDELAGACEVDAVHLLVPPGLHKDLAAQCLELGWHTLVEKPLVLRSEEVAALQELALARGVGRPGPPL